MHAPLSPATCPLLCNVPATGDQVRTRPAPQRIRSAREERWCLAKDPDPLTYVCRRYPRTALRWVCSAWPGSPQHARSSSPDSLHARPFRLFDPPPLSTSSHGSNHAPAVGGHALSSQCNGTLGVCLAQRSSTATPLLFQCAVLRRHELGGGLATAAHPRCSRPECGSIRWHLPLKY